MGHEDEPTDEELEGYLETLSILHEELEPHHVAAPKPLATPSGPNEERQPETAHPQSVIATESVPTEPRFRRDSRPSAKRTGMRAATVAATLIAVVGISAVLLTWTSRPRSIERGSAVESVSEREQSFLEFLMEEDRASKEREGIRSPRYRLKARAGETPDEEGGPSPEEPTKLRSFLDRVFDAFDDLFTWGPKR